MQTEGRNVQIDIDQIGDDDPLWRWSLQYWLQRKGLEQLVGQDAVTTLLARSIFLRLGAGDFVFLQGASAAHLYILVSGLVHIYRREADLGEIGRDAAAKLLRENPGQLVATLQPGESFGQLALSQARARNTTARCERPSLLVKVPRGLYAELLEGPMLRIEAQREEALAAIPLLRPLDRPSLNVLAKLARSHLFPRNSLIARPGDAAERVHFIISGEAEVHAVVRFGEGPGESAHSGSKDVPVATMGPGSCIGGTEAATEAVFEERITAGTAVTTLHFSAADFTRHIARWGETRAMLERVRGDRTSFHASRALQLRRDLGAIAGYFHPATVSLAGPAPSPRSFGRRAVANRRGSGSGPELLPPRPPPVAPPLVAPPPPPPAPNGAGGETSAGGAGPRHRRLLLALDLPGIASDAASTPRPSPMAGGSQSARPAAGPADWPDPPGSPREDGPPLPSPPPVAAPTLVEERYVERFIISGRGGPEGTTELLYRLALGDKLAAEEKALRAASLRIGAQAGGAFLPHEAAVASSEGRAVEFAGERLVRQASSYRLPPAPPQPPPGAGRRAGAASPRSAPATSTAVGALEDLRRVTGRSGALQPSWGLGADRGAAGLLSPSRLRPIRLLSRQRKI